MSTATATPTTQRLALDARQVEFDAIPRSCWDRLLARTSSATPFARWTFHRAWWDAYGSTAHEQYLVCVPAGAGQAGTDHIDWEQAVAIVPLMHRHEVEPEDLSTRTVLREHSPTCTPVPDDAKAVFFGASYHADYATVLAEPDDLPAVADAVARTLATRDPGQQPWDIVDLRRLRDADPALPALERALRAAEPGWDVVREQEDVCPVVSAPSDDWDEYLATLGKKDRHEIRRKLRRAAAVGDVRVEISPPTDDAVELFIDLHNKRFGERGLFPSNEGGARSRRFVRRLAELERSEPRDAGRLHIALVRCAERLVFAAVAFDDGTTCYLYNAGMDPDAAEVSPGVTGTAAYFRNRLAAGRRRFDFLRGNEPYKYEWGARDEPIHRLLVRRGNDGVREAA